MNETRLALTLRDQRPAPLLFHRYEVLLQSFIVDVAEVDIVELHAADFLQLLLDPTTYLQGVLQALSHVFLGELVMGIKQLE
ncbi:hypothetical protein D9M70_511810 [compost metagenome]